MSGVKNRKAIAAITVAAVIAVAAVVAVCLNFSSDSDIFTVSQAGIEDDSQITLISHRGMSALAPENTLEAAEKSAENGYSHIEFDVRRTLDGVWVLMHDSDIKRTTSGKGEVSSLTYKQLLSHLIDEDVEKFGYIAVPTLEQMLDLCAEKELTPVIEIKQDSTDYMLELLNVISAKRTGEFTVISFNREQLEVIHELLNSGKVVLEKNSIDLYWLTDELGGDTLETARSNKEIGVSFNGNKKIKAEQVEVFSAEDIKLATWTINSPKVMSKLYSFGIRTFTTDLATNNPKTEG